MPPHHYLLRCIQPALIAAMPVGMSCCGKRSRRVVTDIEVADRLAVIAASTEERDVGGQWFQLVWWWAVPANQPAIARALNAFLGATCNCTLAETGSSASKFMEATVRLAERVVDEGSDYRPIVVPHIPTSDHPGFTYADRHELLAALADSRPGKRLLAYLALSSNAPFARTCRTELQAAIDRESLEFLRDHAIRAMAVAQVPKPSLFRFWRRELMNL